MHQEILDSCVYRKQDEVERERAKEEKKLSLVLIPHGSLERPPEQDYTLLPANDRFLFSWYIYIPIFFLYRRRLSRRLLFSYSFVIVVRKVRVKVVLNTIYYRIFSYSLSQFSF